MKYNTQTITIKIPAERKFNTEFSSSITSYDEGRTASKAKALSVLLEGAYNKIGRNIPYAEYEQEQKNFNLAVSNMEYLLEKYAK
jgi:hypothetical protein